MTLSIYSIIHTIESNRNILTLFSYVYFPNFLCNRINSMIGSLNYFIKSRHNLNIFLILLMSQGYRGVSSKEIIITECNHNHTM